MIRILMCALFFISSGMAATTAEAVEIHEIWNKRQIPHLVRFALQALEMADAEHQDYQYPFTQVPEDIKSLNDGQVNDFHKRFFGITKKTLTKKREDLQRVLSLHKKDLQTSSNRLKDFQNLSTLLRSFIEEKDSSDAQNPGERLLNYILQSLYQSLSNRSLPALTTDIPRDFFFPCTVNPHEEADFLPINARNRELTTRKYEMFARLAREAVQFVPSVAKIRACFNPYMGSEPQDPSPTGPDAQKFAMSSYFEMLFQYVLCPDIGLDAPLPDVWKYRYYSRMRRIAEQSLERERKDLQKIQDHDREVRELTRQLSRNQVVYSQVSKTRHESLLMSKRLKSAEEKFRTELSHYNFLLRPLEEALSFWQDQGKQEEDFKAIQTTKQEILQKEDDQKERLEKAKQKERERKRKQRDRKKQEAAAAADAQLEEELAQAEKELAHQREADRAQKKENKASKEKGAPVAAAADETPVAAAADEAPVAAAADEAPVLTAAVSIVLSSKNYKLAETLFGTDTMKPAQKMLWEDFSTLMKAFGFSIKNNSGSSRRFTRGDGLSFFLHEPHAPWQEKSVWMHALTEVRKILGEQGLRLASFRTK